VGTGIALAVRLLVPLTIFRWPLAGALLSIAADTIDIVIYNLWGFPSWSYQQVDKALDLYYLSIMAVVVQAWPPFERAIASALFVYRLAGIALFELTGARPLLLVFPNLFEPYYLFVLIAWRAAPDYTLTPRRTLMWLMILLIPKLIQEYLLHYARVLDDLVLSDVLEDWWNAIR
jgi:hypothetical protein